MIKKIFNSLFLKIFKVIEEFYCPSHIKNLIKNGKNRTVLFEIGPENKDNNVCLTAYDILTNNQLKKMLNKDDILLVKSIALAEGDIFLKEKIFKPDGREYYFLFSILSDETWEIQISEIKNSPDISQRLNYKYFSPQFNLTDK